MYTVRINATFYLTSSVTNALGFFFLSFLTLKKKNEKNAADVRI